MTVPAQPDLEAHVWAALGHLPGVTMWAFAAEPMPLVPWLVAYSIQADARARTKPGAWHRAEQARRIIWDLPARPWADGVISYAQVTEGPFWLPDDDGQPRYVLRAEIRVHPVPGRPPAHAGTAPAGRVGTGERS